MKLTFLGHASWLVQTATTAVVSDLIVEDSFRNGTFAICPTRTLDLSAAPRLDALIVSHQHRDHFDLETLRRLDRRTKILCPRDRLIAHALARFGYEDVETFSDWSRHKVGDLELCFTPSENRVPENGILVSDRKAVFWNQVDSVIAPATIEKIREKGPVEFVAHGYDPMLETAALEGRAVDFPAAEYARLLHLAKLLEPMTLAPSSNGYRTAGPQSWFNAFKFPVSRGRFVRDVSRLLPHTRTVIPNPGDVFELDGHRVTARPQAAGFVRTVVDDADELTAFEPTNERPALRDDNPGGHAEGLLRESVRTLFEERMPRACEAVLGRTHPWRRYAAVLEVRVAHPGGDVERWTIEVQEHGARVRRGARSDESDFVIVIAASSLHDLVTGGTRSDVVALSGQVRCSYRSYRVERSGLVTPEAYAPAAVHRETSPLWHFLQLVTSEKDYELRQLDAEIDRMLGVRPELFGRPLWERPAPEFLRPSPRTERAVRAA